jgi:hypothetical protein
MPSQRPDGRRVFAWVHFTFTFTFTFTCSLGLKDEVLNLQIPLIEVPVAATPCFVYLNSFLYFSPSLLILIRALYFIFLLFANFTFRRLFLSPCLTLVFSSLQSAALKNRPACTAKSRKRAGFEWFILYLLPKTFLGAPNPLIIRSTGYQTVLHGTVGFSGESTEISNDEIWFYRFF